MSTIVRPALATDVLAIQALYRHHVLTGVATFEIDPPSVEEMSRRFQALRADDYPYLVGERAGELLGYAYAGPHRPRPAYRFTVEDSIYLAPHAAGQGLGTRLLQALIAAAETRGFRQMIAVIGDSANAASIGVHRRLGFATIGVSPAVGFKFGAWIDSVLMQRSLGAGANTVPIERA